MSDLIDRQQAINVIERMRAYIGHNMERAVGAAFIEILDDVGEDIGRLPSIQFATDTNVGTKLGTNLAQLGTDCISRQAAIDAIDEISREVDDGDGFDYAKWREYFCELPSEHGTNLAEVGTDLISRQAAIDAIDECYCGGEDSCGEPWIYKENAVESIQMIEPIQIAEPQIIYCKDCRKHNKRVGFDENLHTVWKEDACPLASWRGKAQGHEFDYQYCAFGERRTE